MLHHRVAPPKIVPWQAKPLGVKCVMTRTRTEKVWGIQKALGPHTVNSPLYSKGKKRKLPPRGARAKSSVWDKEARTVPSGDGEEKRVRSASKYLDSLLWRPGPEKPDMPFTVAHMIVTEMPDGVPRKLSGSAWSGNRLIEKRAR
jgi:hypothetical protein